MKQNSQDASTVFTTMIIRFIPWLIIIIITHNSDQGSAWMLINGLETHHPDAVSVSDVSCAQDEQLENFSAKLKLVQRNAPIPVFENRVSAGHMSTSDCSIRATKVEGIFDVEVKSFSECGVGVCSQDAQSLCLAIRCPSLVGLKMPEDRMINIKCSPGSPGFKVEDYQQLNQPVHEVIFRRQLPGTDIFSHPVISGNQMRLGEMVRLTSVLKTGQGWTAALLTKVRMKPLNSDEAGIDLIRRHGCRNLSLSTIAPNDPWIDQSQSQLWMQHFDFRLFVFQDMVPKDLIQIVVGIRASKRSPDLQFRCGGGEEGQEEEESPEPGSEYWEQTLMVSVVVEDEEDHVDLDRGQVSELECKIYLKITLSVALIFCIASAAIVLIACVKKYQELGPNAGASSNVINQEHHPKLSLLKSPDLLSVRTTGKGCDETSVTVMSDYKNLRADRQTGSHIGSHRPVTVRSVKRRDKVKNQRQIHLHHQSGFQMDV